MKLLHHLPACLLLATLAITATGAVGEVYKVVDESGRVTYTDKPPASNRAEKVELPRVNTQLSVEVPAKPDEDSEPPGSGGGYDRVEILQPRNGASIPPGQLDVVIQVDIVPELQPNHLVSFLFDGKPVAKPASATSIRVDNLERGAHRIEATIVDERGIKVASSQATTIYVHRASKLINPGSSTGK